MTVNHALLTARAFFEPPAMPDLVADVRFAAESF
jgi:hypothetical protein